MDSLAEATIARIDVRAANQRPPRHASVNRTRTGRAAVDLGNVAAERLASCRADVAVLANAARYRAEAARFPARQATYHRYLAAYRLAATSALRRSGSKYGYAASKNDLQ
ncbi:hypothetical protein SAMN06297144_0746 [Sphingomonas guangdongensis]|uniref:Uncharacterized protein n=1 Tax=Sphingomonas guangdongensis TaxID=1141890 RepID=A0A285QDB0_9SPHN|nr:hypothetical protein [Sphingomonas guangdongensis]SOB79816.1 hypothetical protein SAMN06297144_0746 [Sphingomonas guangdongensis]